MFGVRQVLLVESTLGRRNHLLNLLAIIVFISLARNCFSLACALVNYLPLPSAWGYFGHFHAKRISTSEVLLEDALSPDWFVLLIELHSRQARAGAICADGRWPWWAWVLLFLAAASA